MEGEAITCIAWYGAVLQSASCELKGDFNLLTSRWAAFCSAMYWVGKTLKYPAPPPSQCQTIGLALHSLATASTLFPCFPRGCASYGQSVEGCADWLLDRGVGCSKVPARQSLLDDYLPGKMLGNRNVMAWRIIAQRGHLAIASHSKLPCVMENGSGFLYFFTRLM